MVGVFAEPELAQVVEAFGAELEEDGADGLADGGHAGGLLLGEVGGLEFLGADGFDGAAGGGGLLEALAALRGWFDAFLDGERAEQEANGGRADVGGETGLGAESAPVEGVALVFFFVVVGGVGAGWEVVATLSGAMGFTHKSHAFADELVEIDPLRVFARVEILRALVGHVACMDEHAGVDGGVYGLLDAVEEEVLFAQGIFECM